MKIFTGEQIREADRYTIEHEPVDSIDLMERASETIAQVIAGRVEQDRRLCFFIGKGNNGGDGLAVARILSNAGFECGVHLLFGREELSDDCRYNFDRLPQQVEIISNPGAFIAPDTVIVDAIFGTGLKGPVRDGAAADAIARINGLDNDVISIDLPSGMATEYGNDPRKIVKAELTLTLEFPKLAMLLPEAGECCGEIEILSIELHPGYIAGTETGFYYIDETMAGKFRLPRPKFSHKGDYGHALLICGSEGMCGAAILATGAAMRSGCGLVTTHLPKSCAQALYANAPSAMVSGDPGDCFTGLPHDLPKFTACGIGPGIGQRKETAVALESLLERAGKPLVLDADALNIIAADSRLLAKIPACSILTPHPGEFRRLVGEWKDDREKIVKVRSLAGTINGIIVVKGACTMVCLPDGRVLFNSTGTPGMAKGGSGDVLTGLITGLMARGHTPEAAAILGVYVHGLAGEKAAEYYGKEGMNSGDIIDFIGECLTGIG